MKKSLTILLLFIATLANAQNINQNFEKWTVNDEPINITGIDLSPDGKEVALVGGRMKTVIIYDYANKSILREIPMEKDYSGFNVNYSTKGNYLLLQERVADYSTKKSSTRNYAIIDLKSNKVIQSFDKISDAKISADENELFTLEKGKVYVRDLKTGEVKKKFEPEDATNVLAVSPDGKELAIVKKPSKKEVAMLASKNVSKKVIKAVAKIKFLISIYDLETFELKNLIPDFYDNINQLYYMQNGEKLVSFNVAQNSYVNIALPKNNYQPTRESYSGRSTIQPDFSYNATGEYFGIATFEKFPAVNLYNVETGSVIDQYDTQMKIWKNMKKNIFAGSNTSFVFLPDNKHVLIAYGNSLIKWRFNKE